ncbi:MAG: helix-turn-helix transcriptional regulator [Oscillospiraceae bacterium]|nr:helix-turn-helix transcriptional regulator [Oscillospiraceae bacterium]
MVDPLVNTNHNIATISRMVGYENDVHFMYIYKKKTGFTPTQYRRASISYFR